MRLDAKLLLVIVLLIGLGIYGTLATEPQQPRLPLVALNADPTMNSRWAVVFPNGLVFGISYADSTTDKAEKSAFAVTVVNLADNTVILTRENIVVTDEQQRTLVLKDADPSLESDPLKPKTSRKTRLVYAGRVPDKLIIRYDEYRAVVNLRSGHYDRVLSITEVVRALGAGR